MAAKPEKTLNPDLVNAVNKLLKEVLKDPSDPDKQQYSLTDKMKVLDRALALEKIKQKIEDDSWGSGFDQEEEPSE